MRGNLPQVYFKDKWPSRYRVAMDFLRDCMNDVQNPPLDQFQRNWCLVCANRECERAGMNRSTFDHRAKNWKDTLFNKVPRAASDDPRYDNVRSKLFLPTSGKTPDVKVFMPGVPTVEPPAPSPPRPAAFVMAQAPAQPAPPAPPAPVVPEAEPAPGVTSPEEGGPSPATSSVVPVASPGNTAFQQGMMIEGGSSAPPTTRGDEPQGSSQSGSTFILDDD
jgi:hypothetical protein